MSVERWAPIPSQPGYEASDQGRIRSVDRVVLRSDGTTARYPGKIRKPFRRKQDGRLQKRTRCPREHLLTGPNLVPSKWRRKRERACLACNRAQGYVRRHPWLDMQVVSDKYYAEIAAGRVTRRIEPSRCVELYRAGASSAAIARELGCSPRTVINALRAARVEIRPRGATPGGRR